MLTFFAKSTAGAAGNDKPSMLSSSCRRVLSFELTLFELLHDERLRFPRNGLSASTSCYSEMQYGFRSASHSLQSWLSTERPVPFLPPSALQGLVDLSCHVEGSCMKLWRAIFPASQLRNILQDLFSRRVDSIDASLRLKISWFSALIVELLCHITTIVEPNCLKATFASLIRQSNLSRNFGKFFRSQSLNSSKFLPLGKEG